MFMKISNSCLMVIINMYFSNILIALERTFTTKIIVGYIFNFQIAFWNMILYILEQSCLLFYSILAILKCIRQICLDALCFQNQTEVQVESNSMHRQLQKISSSLLVKSYLTISYWEYSLLPSHSKIDFEKSFEV